MSTSLSQRQSASVKSNASHGSLSSSKSKKNMNDLYKFAADVDSDEEMLAKRNDQPSSSSDKKKLQKRDRVYQHLQHQMADQAAARAAWKDRVHEKGNFELFVDRQRQAAVVLGERDIAGDNKAKRKRERAKGDAEAADATEYITYLSQGIYEMKCGSAEVALVYLDKAVELETEDELPLVVRSECLNKLDLPERALEDAAKAMELNPDNTRALISKAIALYNMGEFEASLIQFERGWRVRKGRQMKRGLMQCKDAILNTVGNTAKGFDKKLIAKMLKEKEKQRKLAAKTPEERLGEKTRSKSQQQKEAKRQEKLNKRQDRVLLGQVAGDASFLRGILEPGVSMTDENISEEQRRVMEIATDALQYLEKRKTFWQQTAMCST